MIARTSAFQFKDVSLDIREVGQRLGADLVIEGSVRKAGAQLRITAQAIHTESGHHLWSETFRRELKDVFTIQEEIAESVAGLLRVHMPEVRVRSSARNVDAYTRYLRARFLIHQQCPEALRTALQQLREVTELFPDYAPAYSGMAAASGLRCLFGEVSGRDMYPEIKTNAERGYLLDPDSGETCTVLGGLRGWFEYRWSECAEGEIANLVTQAFVWRRIGLVSECKTGVVLFGQEGEAETLKLQQFLSRNGYPYRLVQDQPLTASHSTVPAGRDYEARPAIGLSDGRVLYRPKIPMLADELGITEIPDARAIYDVAVVGGGPAGLCDKPAGNLRGWGCPKRVSKARGVRSG